jgi:hypothetical protein
LKSTRTKAFWPLKEKESKELIVSYLMSLAK